MAKKEKTELAEKYVIAYDTLCSGWECMMDGDSKSPMLFDTQDEAYSEIFDGNYSMLDAHLRDGQLEEYNVGVTPEMVNEMGGVLCSGDVNAMRRFLDKYPECNDSQEWIEPAEEFIKNRKAFLTNAGVKITGTKISL